MKRGRGRWEDVIVIMEDPIRPEIVAGGAADARTREDCNERRAVDSQTGYMRCSRTTSDEEEEGVVDGGEWRRVKW